MKVALVFRTLCLVLVMFMITQMASATIANEHFSPGKREDGRESGDDGDHGEPAHRYREHDGWGRCRPTTPDSFTEIPNLTFDHALVESTPHWIFLAAGEREKGALLSYIGQASVSREKKTEWKQFMMQMWEKYPVAYEKMKSTPRLVLGDPHRRYSLTKWENETFREIERYIAEDMEMMQGNQIIVQWAGDTHSNFIRESLLKEFIADNYYLDTASEASKAPDDWYVNDPIPFKHQYEHGYVPYGVNIETYPTMTSQLDILGVGVAPDKFEQYAQLSRMAFAQRNYDDAFTNMGYASHFISDLGNPYHTPNVLVIPLQFVDMPFSLIALPNAQVIFNYKVLHDGYESSTNQHLVDYGNTDESTDLRDPLYSAKIHAVASWAFGPPLMYQCYWHYVIFRNFDYASSPGILFITENRIGETAKMNRGLVRYVTAGKPITYTITPSASPGGSISPSSPVTITYGEARAFSITPEPGFLIQDVKVNGHPMGSISQFTFTMDTIDRGTGDQTIAVNFLPVSQPSSDWIWARDGWGDWQHGASWSGTETGANSEYGPLIVGDHGEHGIQTSLKKGTAAAYVRRTFADPTGEGWRMLTFEGALSSSDRPEGRWMKIEVNGVQVFGSNELSTPPGSAGEKFTIKASFPHTTFATVNISHGQDPAWGPLFVMDYYSIEFNAQADGAMTAGQVLPPILVSEEDMILNETVTGEET